MLRQIQAFEFLVARNPQAHDRIHDLQQNERADRGEVPAGILDNRDPVCDAAMDRVPYPGAGSPKGGGVGRVGVKLGSGLPECLGRLERAPLDQLGTEPGVRPVTKQQRRIERLQVGAELVMIALKRRPRRVDDER